MWEILYLNSLKSWNARRPQLEWVPDCDESGFYKPLQCHKNGFCWCSTSIGNEISGTKQYSAGKIFLVCNLIHIIWTI